MLVEEPARSRETAARSVTKKRSSHRRAFIFLTPTMGFSPAIDAGLVIATIGRS